MIPLKLRPHSQEDINFIINSWILTMKMEMLPTDANKDIKFEFCRTQKKNIFKALEKAKTLIACNPEDESQIFGYIVAEQKTLHFVYVKKPFRGFKIATTLIDNAMITTEPITITQRTYYTKRLPSKLNFDYNPRKFYL